MLFSSILACALASASFANAQDDTFGMADRDDTNVSLDAIKEITKSGDALDWKPVTDNSKHTRHKPDFCFCNGHHEEPTNLSPDAEMEPRIAPLRLSADETKYAVGDSTLSLSGNVAGFQGSLQLFADALSFNRNTQEVSLSGNVQLREPGTLILGEQATLNRKDGSARFNEARFVAHNSGANGIAQAISRSPNGEINMEGASYSLCHPEDNIWSIKAERITLDTENNEGVTRNARMHIKGVPVMYMPYFNFPLNNKRKSGFLFPNYSSSSEGSDFSIPYYLNLADNYDVTITPRIVSKHGAMIETEARYLNKKHSAVAGFNYLPSEKDSASKQGARWLTSFRETGYFDDNRRFTHEIDFQRVSDDSYMSDLGTAGLDVRRETQLKSHAQIAYQADNWDGRVYIEGYQALKNNLTPSYKRLPQISFNYNKPITPRLNADLSTEYSYFDHPDKDSKPVGSRLFIEPSLTFTDQTAARKSTIKLGMKQISHDVDSGDSNAKNTSASSANITLDNKLVFERTSKNNTRQTLEPRIQYHYAKGNNTEDAPIFDTNKRSDSFHQFFNGNRFSGRDRVSDANRITLGLSSKQFNHNNEKVIEAGIAQQVHLSDREVSHLNTDTATADVLSLDREERNRNISNTAFFLNYNPSKQLQINSEYLVNSSNAHIESASIHTHFSPYDNKLQIFNAGYQYSKDVNAYLENPYLNDDIHQLSASAVLKARKNLYVFAESKYDLSNHQTREELVGLEYNSCCWKARLAYHKEELVDPDPSNSDIDHNHGIRLELQLKGLSGISDKMSSLLSENIEGFDKREENYE
ncbi:MAG: LPS assembly protein LptD [Pseudomonadota bacterium]